MKKFILTLFALALLCAPAYAFEVEVPQYDVYLGGDKLEYKNTEYPLLTYKDITYFPMTYDYTRRLGLTCSWYDGAFYLSCCPVWEDFSPQWAPAVTALDAEIAEYPIYVNGKLIDNANEEYPILNARGITYFPLTWQFAREELDLFVAWDGRLGILPGLSNIVSGSGFSKVEDSRAYFWRDYGIVGFMENGGFMTGGGGPNSKFYVFDAETRTVTPYSEFIYDIPGDLVYDKLNVDGNYLLYEDAVIADVAETVAADAQMFSYGGLSAGGTEYDIGGGKVLLEVNLFHFIPPNMMSRNPYHHSKLWFIREGGEFTSLSLDTGCRYDFRKAEYIDGVSWVCLEKLIEGEEVYCLYTVAEDNSLIPIADPDHENIELLGRLDGKPVVLATWKSEREAVSPVNDGYFTIEADGRLNKIYPYVYNNGEVVLNNRLYLLIFRHNAILDVLADEEIPFPPFPYA